MAPWEDFPARHNWAAAASVPLFRERRLWGTLAVVSDQPGIFNQDVLGLVAQIGRLLSWGLDDRDHRQALRLDHQRQYYLAGHDPLTGLPNRLSLAEALETAVKAADATGSAVLVGLLDLDDFKAVNDTWGHAAGDEVLRTVAERLRRLVREEDYIARFGGDEFVLVLTCPPPAVGIAWLPKRLAAALRDFPYPDGSLRPLPVSLGLTCYPADAGDGERLLRHADHALYHAKAAKSRRSRWWAWWQPERG